MPSAPDLAPARDAELPDVAALLPEAFPLVGDAAETIVARSGGHIAGAIALAWRPGGFRLLVRVRPEHRRKGIGSALIDAAAGQARGETHALRAWLPVEEGSAAAALLDRTGFGIVKRLQYFESDAAAFAARMGRLRARLAARIPPAAQVVPISAVPVAALADLVGEAFAMLPAELGQRIANQQFRPDLSIAVRINDRLVGAMLCQTHGDIVDVDVNVVVPEYRGGWVNVVLLEQMSRHCREAGFARFHFGAEPHVRDTLNLATRSDARPLPDRLTYVRVL